MTVNYDDMSREQRLTMFKVEHHKEGKSILELANAYGTYPNKLRRDAKSLGVEIRNKSEAQKKALELGKASHPTEGKERSAETKVKISDGRSEAWENISPEERARISAQSKKQYDDMDNDKRQLLHKKASEAVRRAAKEGSKLEKHILKALIDAGYRVDFHKEHLLLNERLQLDLFLPKMGVAIEVDGPSHFLPIWGNKTLQRNKKSDNDKNSLLLSRGMYVIRIKQDGYLSDKFKRDTVAKLVETLEKISKNDIPLGQRYIEL